LNRRFANVANVAKLAVNGSRYVPDPADFIRGDASLRSHSDRLGIVSANPVRGRSPVGDGLGLRARSLELPGSARKERRRARPLTSQLRSSNAHLEAFAAVDDQDLANDMARARTAQKKDRVGDIVANGDPADRDARQHRLLIEPAGP
jgi:hypothetical protein